MKPLIVINVKTYPTGTGPKLLRLAKLMETVKKETGSKIILLVPATDIYPISKAVNLPIYAQHADLATYGANTGAILPESIKFAGAKGTILNHAEKKIDHKIIKKTILTLKLKNLKSIVCADTIEEVKKIARFGPDIIAIEPPELIGGNHSVTKARPEIITETVKIVKRINPSIKILVGAGIKTAYDIRKSMELGADGVLIASGITGAKDPKKVLIDMLS
ncbi:MAG: triose-phosphate isomerase [Candidatus Aenigmarchaeota archaeon]|nr:triose-phosphate isomerase [Candidatus Aenigmarchaeota archaeon]